jgi:hypothetical protein
MQNWIIEPSSAINSHARRRHHLNTQWHIGIEGWLGRPTSSLAPSLADGAF